MIEQIKAFAGDYRIAGVKTFTGMEGSGWEGQLFRGDKFIGFVGDDATGGPVRIQVRNGHEMNALTQHAYSKTQDQFERVERFIDDLVNYQLAIKRLQGKAKKIIIAIIDDQPKVDANGVPVEFNTFKVEYSPTSRAKVLAKYPNAKIINEELDTFEIPRAARNPKL